MGFIVNEFVIRQTKRSFEGGDDIPCVPSLKKLRIWNDKEIECNTAAAEQTLYVPFIPIQSPFTVTKVRRCLFRGKIKIMDKIKA